MSSKQLNMVQAINSTLDMLMKEDDSIILLGEDIGKDGGVFRVTEGLQAKYGSERVIDTPLVELGIVGMAIGMALTGLKPVPEIQFQDFIFTAFECNIFHCPCLKGPVRRPHKGATCDKSETFLLRNVFKHCVSFH